jgi:hypothetical protein
MKTSLVVLLCLLGVGFVAAGSSEDLPSGEARNLKHRKHTCGGLVTEPPKPSKPTPKPTTKAPASAAPSVPTVVPTSFVPTPAPGQCVCTPEGSGSGSGEEGSGSGEVGGSGSGSGSGDFESHCELIEIFYNISITLTVEQQVIFIEWIHHIERTILIRIDITDEQKIVLIGLSLKRFCEVNIDISIAIEYQWIGTWGYVKDLTYVAIEITSDYSLELITIDESGSCEWFDAWLNATEGDEEKHNAVLIFIEEVRTEILIKVSLTIEEKMVLIYKKCLTFFSAHASWKSFFLSIKINKFIEFESFFQVSFTYYQISTIDVVLGGSVDECVFIKSLRDASTNASLSTSTKSQIFQMIAKFEAYFKSETRVTFRLEYVNAQSYQFFKLMVSDVTFQISIERISCGEWGDYYQIIFCGAFYQCHPDDFPPKDVTTPAVETTVEATTVVPTTVASGPVCSKRPDLIVIDSGANVTCLTTSVNTVYNTWSRTDKANFASYKKRIESAIWGSEFNDVESKLKQISTVFTGYAPSGSAASVQVMSITITCKAVVWGTVGDFCGCQK